MTTDNTGTMTGEIRYYPWGGVRYSSGNTPTNYRFTGQKWESSFNLYFYGARWYDPAAGRFVQADTIVPGGVQGLDRYAYVNNNPLKYTDPSGLKPCEGWDEYGNCITEAQLNDQWDDDSGDDGNGQNNDNGNGSSNTDN